MLTPEEVGKTLLSLLSMPLMGILWVWFWCLRHGPKLLHAVCIFKLIKSAFPLMTLYRMKSLHPTFSLVQGRRSANRVLGKLLCVDDSKFVFRDVVMSKWKAVVLCFHVEKWEWGCVPRLRVQTILANSVISCAQIKYLRLAWYSTYLPQHSGNGFSSRLFLLRSTAYRYHAFLVRLSWKGSVLLWCSVAGFSLPFYPMTPVQGLGAL